MLLDRRQFAVSILYNRRRYYSRFCYLSVCFETIAGLGYLRRTRWQHTGSHGHS